MADTTVTLADGSVFTTSSLQILDLQTILQRLAANSIGLYTGDQTTDWSGARLMWITDGQPGFTPTDDVSFVFAEPVDEAVFRARDTNRSLVNTQAVEVDNYTQVWRAGFILYGPNALRNARIIASIMRTESMLSSFLAYSLCPVISTATTPMRLHEERQGQWYERADYSMLINEGVQETITRPRVTSASAIFNAPSIDVESYGGGGYGQGSYGGGTVISTKI